MINTRKSLNTLMAGQSKITGHKNPQDYRGSIISYLIDRILKAEEKLLNPDIGGVTKYQISAIIKELKTQLSILRDDLI